MPPQGQAAVPEFVPQLTLADMANTLAAVTTTAFVVGGGSLTLHYVFFATVEIACMALIVWSVWAQGDSAQARERVRPA